MIQSPDAESIALDPDRVLALAYLPVRARPAIETLWALDLRLAQVVRDAREPGLGAIRLAWWRDALRALDDRPAPPEPLLRRVAETLLPAGVTGAMVAPTASGWSPLLEPHLLDEAGVQEVAEGRGETLFVAAAAALGDAARPGFVRMAGRGWALADIAFGYADAGLRAQALHAAGPALAEATAVRWPSRLRPLGMLAMLAAGDVRRGRRVPGTPARALRMLRHRLTGR